MAESPYMDVHEAADYLRVSHWTVRYWLSTGKLQRHKAGKTTLIRRTDAARFVHPETRTEAAARNRKRELAKQ